MRVSVVIPTFNRGGVIAHAVRSVLEQTYGDFELLVIDDGSTDDTEARVRSLTDPRVHYIRQPNGGVSAARNHGVRRARGNAIAFLDSDDAWMPDKLARDVAFLDAHPDVDAVFADVRKHDGDAVVPSFVRAAPVIAGMLTRHAGTDEIVFSRREMRLLLLQEVPILPSAFTIRRAALLAAQGFDETWRSFEDWDLFLRLADRTAFGYIDRPLAVQTISPDSLHRIAAAHGRTKMLARLKAERRAAHGDPEAQAAAANGITGLHSRLGWECLDRGARREACVAFARGYLETRRTKLLLRAVAAMLRPPTPARPRCLPGARACAPPSGRRFRAAAPCASCSRP